MPNKRNEERTGDSLFVLVQEKTGGIMNGSHYKMFEVGKLDGKWGQASQPQPKDNQARR